MFRLASYPPCRVGNLKGNSSPVKVSQPCKFLPGHGKQSIRDRLSKSFGKTDFHVCETLFLPHLCMRGVKMHKGGNLQGCARGGKLHSCARGVKVS